MAKPNQAQTPASRPTAALQQERLRAQQQAMSQAFSRAAQIGRSMQQAPSPAQHLSNGRTGQLPSPTSVGTPGTDGKWNRMVGSPANTQSRQRERDLEMD